MKKSNKKQALLSESVVRQWSKLVGTTLTPQRLMEMGYGAEEEEEDKLEPASEEVPVEEPAEEEPKLDEPAAPVGEEELVKDLVSAIADAIQDVSGIPVEVAGVEPEAGEEHGEEAPVEEPKEEVPPPPAGEEEKEEEEDNKEPVMEMKDEEEEETITSFGGDKGKKLEEEEEKIEEFGRGRSGDVIEPDRKAKGSGKRSPDYYPLKESVVAEIAKRVAARLVSKKK